MQIRYKLTFGGKYVKMVIVAPKIMKGNIPSWQPGLQLFLRLSAWIGVPVLIALVVGNYLDSRYHTDPWLFLLSVGIAFFVSTWALIYYGLKEIQRIDSEVDTKDTITKIQ